MIFTKSHAANTWGSVAESQKKVFLILNLLHGWLGLGRLQRSFYS